MQIENKEESIKEDDYILEVKDLIYKYEDGFVALNDINLGFKRGASTAIIGSNGAGKSTLLLTLNGINRPIKGEVIFNGERIQYNKRDLMKIRKSVGIVFQNPDNQLFSASVMEDVSFGPMNLGMDLKIVEERVDEALERTGIMDLKDRSTHSLSFGQKKKIAIAGIIAMEPEVMILDEPTAGLDPRGVKDIMSLLKDIQERMNLTLIISTHDMDIVPLYCNYTYVIDKGKVVSSGSTEDVFKNGEVMEAAGLMTPKATQLIEGLKKDGFNLNGFATTVDEARVLLNKWKKSL